MTLKYVSSSENSLSDLGFAFDELRMLRIAAANLSLLYPADIFEEIAPGDVLEILDSEGVQRYRSLNYFSYCNYCLEDLRTRDREELYEIESSVRARLEACRKLLLSGEERLLRGPRIAPAYRLQERLSLERAAFQVREKCLARAVSGSTGEIYLISAKEILRV